MCREASRARSISARACGSFKDATCVPRSGGGGGGRCSVAVVVLAGLGGGTVVCRPDRRQRLEQHLAVVGREVVESAEHLRTTYRSRPVPRPPAIVNGDS